MKKCIFILIAICCISIIMLLPGMILGGVFDSPPSEKTIKNIFLEDYEGMNKVVDYLDEVEENDIYIILADVESSDMDEDIVRILNGLKKQGYTTISKKCNEVSFTRWSKRDFGSGFIYSADKKIDNLEFPTCIEELPYDNWYYYEEDFNKWKQLNER